MQTAENIINHVKDAYVWLADRVAAHPHATIAVYVVSLYLVWRFS